MTAWREDGDYPFIKVQTEREEEAAVTYGRPLDTSRGLIERLGMLQVAVQSWNPRS